MIKLHCHSLCFETFYRFACELMLLCLCPQTLCALFRGVHQKNKSASGFDIINMLMGFDKAEQRMKVRWQLHFEKHRAQGDTISLTLPIYLDKSVNRLRRTSWRDWTACSVATALRVWRVSASNCCCVWWRWGVACAFYVQWEKHCCTVWTRTLTNKEMLSQVTDNISQNTILEYVMINSIFEAILQVIAT